MAQTVGTKQVLFWLMASLPWKWTAPVFLTLKLTPLEPTSLETSPPEQIRIQALECNKDVANESYVAC